MNRERIVSMIDKRIVESLVEGHAIPTIQGDLDDKMHKFAGNIRESDKKVDLLKLLSIEVDTITPTRTRYQIIYIKECQRRIKDLEWLMRNKHKFPRLSNSQVFNLIKLKEKLSFENAVLMPF